MSTAGPSTSPGTTTSTTGVEACALFLNQDYDPAAGGFAAVLDPAPRLVTLGGNSERLDELTATFTWGGQEVLFESTELAGRAAEWRALDVPVGDGSVEVVLLLSDD